MSNLHTSPRQRSSKPSLTPVHVFNRPIQATRALQVFKSRWILALMALMAVGAIARFYHLEEKSLWSDEIATIATSQGNSIDPDAFQFRHQRFDALAPITAQQYLSKATQSHGVGNFAQTTHVLQQNVHPPLFFWFMNLWIGQFGFSPDVLRWPAVLFGVLCIPVIYWVALRLTARPACVLTHRQRHTFALLSASLMTSSAYQINHSQDARQYTWLVLLALLAVGQTLRITQGKAQPRWWHWVALAITLAAGIYSQYFFIVFSGFIVAHLVWGSWKNPRLRAGLSLLLTLDALLLLLWTPCFREQVQFLKSAGHYTSGLWEPLQLPEKLWRIGCEFFLPYHPLGKLMPLLLLGLVLLTGYLQHRFQQTSIRKTALGKVHSSEHPPNASKLGPMAWMQVVLTSQSQLSYTVRFLLSWLVLVVGGQIGLDLLKHSHTATIRRYLLLASPACYLLLAYGLLFVRTRWRTQAGQVILLGATTLMIIAMVQDSFHLLCQDHTSSDEFKQAAQWINHHSQPGDWVLVNKSGAMAVGMAYYLKPHTRMLGLNIPNASALPLRFQELRHALQTTEAKPPRLWLVWSHHGPSIQARVQDWLKTQGYTLHTEKKVRGVKVGLWE